MAGSYFEQYKRLKKKEKWAYNLLSLLGTLVGISFFVPYASILSSLLGINPDECVKCQEGGVLWLSLFLLGIPVFIYSCASLALFTYSFKQYKEGKISRGEVKLLILGRGFPKSWLAL